MSAPASTQDHLDIEDIREGVVLLKNNAASAIVQTTAVNFDLLSEIEQDAMIAGYSQFLNSLTFSLQVLIRSRKLDISDYVQKLEAAAETQANPYLKEQINLYKTYVAELISKNDVLDKKFYLVIPYQELSFRPQPSFLDAVLVFLGLPAKTRPRVNRRALLERARIQLDPKVDQIMKQLSRLGLKARRLNTQELVELFYDIYNPNIAQENRLQGAVAEYTTPMVQAALERS